MSTLWRVTWWLASAAPGQPGHPDFLPQQGAGRLDNPHLYPVRYLAGDPAAAVGETLANFSQWTSPALLTTLPRLPEAVRALLRCELEDTARLIDLDDPATLARIGLRPSRVVTGDRGVSQRWAADLFALGDADGVSWWSRWNADWTVHGVWRPEKVTVVGIEPLTYDHPALRRAADILNRPTP